MASERDEHEEHDARDERDDSTRQRIGRKDREAYGPIDDAERDHRVVGRDGARDGGPARGRLTTGDDDA